MFGASGTRGPTVTLRQAGDRITVTARIYDVPRAVLFEAWTRPELLSQWWNDVRGRHPFSGTIREVLPPDRLVFTQIVDAGLGHEAIVTVDFVDIDERARVTITTECQTIDIGELPPPGALDRLAEMLERYPRIQRGVATLRGAKVVESTIEVVGEPNAMRRSINSSR